MDVGFEGGEGQAEEEEEALEGAREDLHVAGGEGAGEEGEERVQHLQLLL